MNMNSLEEVLRFAIRKEADAAAFYRMAADRSNPGVKKAFEELAREEEGHQKKLEGFDPKKVQKMKVEKPQGLGIAEWVEDVPFSSDMSYADLLRMAIKNEEKSESLYTTTARSVTDPPLRKILMVLAQEETRHKKRLEKIYDDEVLTEF
jgi:rubrerythrin